MDHAPYYVNNAAARGEAAATSQKRVHELSSPSVDSHFGSQTIRRLKTWMKTNT